MRIKYILLPAVLYLFTVGLDSCSKSSSGNTTPVAPAVDSFLVKTDSHFGSIITDGKGNTLYFFSLDASGSSACTGNCLTSWPVSYIANPKIGAGLNASDFAVITRSDGAMQTTYKGWPLYTFANDSKPGDVNGDGIENIWYVAKPDYTVMLVKNQLIGNDGVMYDSTYTPGTGGTYYMTDDHGVTFYSFSEDKSGTNNYTKSDFSNDSFWPIVQISTIQSVPSTFDKTAFSSITVFGKPQMTYKGWPVYRFGPDALLRGSNKGISVPTPGIWPVMDQFSPAAPQ